jgi:hypothetical protein
VVNVFVTILYTMEAPVVAVFRQVANTCVVMRFSVPTWLWVQKVAGGRHKHETRVSKCMDSGSIAIRCHCYTRYTLLHFELRAHSPASIFG